MPQNPFLTTDRQIIGDIYTSNETIDNLVALCDEMGSRFGGTPSEKQSAEFLKAKLESYGLQNVHLEPIDYIGWRRGETTFEIVEPIQKEIPCISLPHSPAANLTAKLVDMDDGAPVDFDNRADEIANNIVMTTSEVNPKGTRRWVHRNEKYGRCLLADASGFIFVNHYPGYGPATGGIGHDGAGAGLIPAISIAYEDGKFIKRLIERHGDVTVRISSNDVCEPMVSWNVIGDLPGQADSPQMVMLGSHYDGHDIAQGAADPASGTVAVLEAARTLAQYAPNLPHTVRFILWGIEEIGLLGSAYYAQAHDHEFDNLRFYLNMDMAGVVNPMDIVLNEWEELEPLFKQWQKEMALDFEVGQSLFAHSDHFSLLKKGVPTGGIDSLRRSGGGRGYGHTKFDTVDKVTLKGMREAASLAARLALRIATHDEWPVQRRSAEAVQAILDHPDYQEEQKLFASVGKLYEQ